MSLPLRGRSGGTGCAAVWGGTSAPTCARSTALPAGVAAAYLLPADAGAERELCVLLRPGGRGEGERAVRLRRPGRGRGGRRPLASARAGRSATNVAVPPGRCRRGRRREVRWTQRPRPHITRLYFITTLQVVRRGPWADSLRGRGVAAAASPGASWIRGVELLAGTKRAFGSRRSQRGGRLCREAGDGGVDLWVGEVGVYN